MSVLENLYAKKDPKPCIREYAPATPIATPCATPGSRQPQEEEAQEEAAANRQGGAVASRGEGARGHGFPLTVRARLDKVEWGTALKYMEFIERE